ncbi:hypothetical protein QYE76_042147 [Lolium multiflorum]|uniref:CCHC-type domain-containing protein n=1 Tax=Lolium multiflorum TaxID=4521 RepID=A0AAD8TGD5_LOLMU|nr:hypothetical protein QYE76_042147 [Lolium multiflorum]
MITADLKGSPEPPISERILFSFKAYSWVDGLAHALQEGLARVCGQNIAALRGSRFAHFARHDTMGEPMALSSHPVLKIHVQHLDFMLHETRKDLELTRVHAHRAQMALAHHADAIRLLAKDRRSLRLQRAKNVATITRLREKIRTLEVTVRTQQDQIQEMEEDGEDIQGGDDFLSDDNDFEDDEFTDEEDYEFLESAEMGSFPSMWMKTMRNSCTSFTYVGKHRNNSSGGFTSRNNRPPAQTYHPNYSNNNGGPPKPGGNNNNNRNPNSHNNNGNNTNTNTGPRTGSNAIPVTPKDKSTVNCYECGVVGHYSKECPKKLAKIAANTAAPAQQQRRFAGRRNQNNNNGRFYHMTATEAQEAHQTLTSMYFG